MTGPRYPDLIAKLPSSVPFVGPEVQERQRGAPFLARLGANESVFGPSPFAVAAMQDAAGQSWQYADATNYDLIQAISSHMGVRPDNVIIGEGIDSLLGYLVRLLVTLGDAVVTSDGAYPTFNYHVTGYGGTLHKVPFRDDHEDIDALMDKAAEVDAKLIYLSNPDNPMGSWHSGSRIERALESLPDGTVLLLDEAYIEFAPEGTAPVIDADDPRVIRMRTFSKAFGMAGARVGYGIGAPDLIKSFDKVRNHFGMSRISQAGALAAYEDIAWLEEVVGLVAEARDRITAIAKANGLTPLPSATNFVTVDCGQDGVFARAVLAALIEEGVFVRMPFVSPGDRCIRISAGRPADLDIFEAALPRALEKARG
ncbi:pyridoxal phosphate-dependent aminotransferase [Marivita sp. XM-24bin2]|uniref:pyridoxal phosphate-dependent aminotransferase n=1 Tax=Marivita sp. XM-24bin2 TaxID=2133951 RepID=UPI000D7A46A6|nr:pyridoxal phosphate-dependent aminotransferase [Marivita sp. XM-24bin2]MCR9108855.1 pyridoxal phosphate-dependent aminotransferase [Paracoccaceae bacterium]PWL34911.1 MAG: pyridoxal phosphate-dependent aminotransferase [Marivita sp. XM-24bin2]